MPVTQPDGYWKFDESSGNAADATANANTLTNNNTATYGAGALNNGCILAVASSQYFSHADNALFSPSTSFSVSGWINLTSAPGAAQRAFVYKNTAAAGGLTFGIDLGVEPDGAYVIVSDDGSAGAAHIDEYDSAASILPATGGWHHYAFIVDVANHTVTFYLDNVSKTMTHRGGGGNISTLYNGTQDFTIGGSATGTRLADAKMDEVAYWKDYKLTSGEVASLYNSGTPPSYASLWGNAPTPRRRIFKHH